MLQRISWIFILFTLISTIFYLGYLYGIREIQAEKITENVVINANGSRINSIDNIQEKDVIGVAVRDNKLIKERYGKLYYILNELNQVEFTIRLEEVPVSLTQPENQATITLPDELVVKYAVRQLDDNNLDTYRYLDINNEEESILRFSEVKDNKKSGKFSGIIDRPLMSNNLPTIERIVLLSKNSENQNIFTDDDPNLPVKIRGNTEVNPPIPSQPAPFFWVIF